MVACDVVRRSFATALRLGWIAAGNPTDDHGLMQFGLRPLFKEIIDESRPALARGRAIPVQNGQRFRFGFKTNFRHVFPE
jgi:hypothetical protein